MPVHAESEPCALTVDTSVGFYTDYMFRGFQMFNGNSVQPAVTVNYDTGFGKFSVGAWSHLSADANSPTERFTEVDQIAKFAFNIDDLSVTVGNTWYTYPEDKTDLPETSEAFLSLSYATLLTPTVTVYHDYRAFDAQYYELGFSQAIEGLAGEGSTITPYVTFAFASNYDGVYADNGFVQATLGASTNLAMGPVTVTPSLNYTAENDDALDNNFWFGFNISKSF